MQKAIPRLKKRIQALQEFQPEAITSSKEAWAVVNPLNASVDDALTRTFGNSTHEYQRYKSAANLSWPLFIGDELPVREIVAHLQDDKRTSIALLETAVASLEEQIEEEGANSQPNAAPQRAALTESRKVFIVHGHDIAARETIAHFLTRCEFEPVVLHEQANQGRTIIEKFEQNADVGFAVVLLTPDDEVCSDNEQVVRRARQNVILELGYFIGRLGRDRVCAFKSGEIELPSDILGVVWTELDTLGAWRQSLARELEAAGYSIDWNKVMRGS
jgi:predicted nucleotide-binding protein